MKLETKHKEIIWCIILSLGLIIFFATGCKPKEILHVRTVTAIDSTAVLNLSSEVSKLTKENATLKTDLERFREEVIKLRSEVSKHEINYNTDAPLKPDGYYPIASEVKTISKTEYDRAIKEYEKVVGELKKEIQHQELVSTNLEQTVQKVAEENKDLKNKTTPTTGFNFKLFLLGMGAGIVLILFVKLRL
jgi:predicted RNase H-like nuclease (RuvC/YqgF family)